ncbi:hypothetical protein ACFVRU_18760, partial [Streptomyces sp. NPDC057927]
MPVTPSPTAATTPAASTPGISGGRPARWYRPARTSASARFTPAATTRIDQVRAELDELSDYLRRHDGGGSANGRGEGG